MTKNELTENIKRKKSFLCVGLDSDIEKLPEFILALDDPIFEFNKRIIEATNNYAIAYKPNIAFYESQGSKGWNSLEKTIKFIKTNYPDMFLIADAKRSDIGNTAKMYAKTFFEELKFDAVTVSPYMGEDSVLPFLQYEDKWVILLALTSNKGAFDFQYLKTDSNMFLFEEIIEKSKKWGNENNMMYVVGATKSINMRDVRRLVPNSYLLVPGIGAQGGNLEEIVKYGITSESGLIINSSRAIIFADSSRDFAKVAKEKAMEIQSEMSLLIDKYLI